MFTVVVLQVEAALLAETIPAALFQPVPSQSHDFCATLLPSSFVLLQPPVVPVHTIHQRLTMSTKFLVRNLMNMLLRRETYNVSSTHVYAVMVVIDVGQEGQYRLVQTRYLVTILKIPEIGSELYKMSTDRFVLVLSFCYG